MSANYTKNYNLCQWEPADKVLREDFNADNAKLDAALAGLARRASALEGVSSALEGSAYTIQNPQVTVGSYTGDGEQSRVISLGFRPRAVLVLRSTLEMGTGTYYNSGIALDGFVSAAAAITAGGFEVYDHNDGKIWRRTNFNGQAYIYFAFK